MKHILLLILSLTLLLPARAQQTGITLSGVEWTYNESSFIGSPFYAVKKDAPDASPRGTIRFTPGGDAWHFSWEYNDAPQPLTPYDDSTRYDFPILGDGRYTLTATRPDGAREQRSFTLFHSHLAFSTSLSNILDCEYITINVAYAHTPTYDGRRGWENIRYWVEWDGRERELSSIGDYLYKEIAQSVATQTTDADYALRIRDGFGLEWTPREASGRYTSVIPEAAFELELGNTVSVVGEVHDQMGQAPLEVAFHNESSNADRYEWLLYRDTAEITTPPLLWTDSLIDGQPIDALEPPLRTYPHPGHYKVILIAENARSGCRDTSDDAYVHVVESLLEVPNVFTPNGDGKNDLFMVRALSIESFHGVILNRWGRQIFEWHDPAQGWDGRIHGTLANPGTYYYVITARGRERVSPPRYVKKGALMLIR